MFKTSQGERTIHAFSAIITFFEFVHCLRFENVWHLTYLFLDGLSHDKVLVLTLESLTE